MKLLSTAALAVLVFAGPASAATHITFAKATGVYATTPTVGQGGTVVKAHGVDYYTYGAPEQHYHLLGVLTVRAGKDPIKSSAVAAAIKKVGGDAAILRKSDTHSAGVRGMGRVGNAPGWISEDRETTATFEVVRYIK